jgi:hypothetical protein
VKRVGTYPAWTESGAGYSYDDVSSTAYGFILETEATTMNDPTRRNRNIGTAKRGHGANNKLVIPTRCHPDLTRYYETLRNYTIVTRQVKHHPFTFLVEDTRTDCYHACTVDDIAHVLDSVPTSDVSGIELIVLRQPKRKEEVLDCAWGRWASDVAIDEHTGSAIFLEAASVDTPMRWDKSLPPDRQKELDRLRQDGHAITTTRRHHIISLSLDSVRSTQLYRTLLHEIGHHVDYTRSAAKFRRKPSSEKERFAHRYADELRSDLEKRKIIPFRRILSARRLEQDRLRISDFKVM